MLLQTKYAHVHDETEILKLCFTIGFYKIKEILRGPVEDGIGDGPDDEGFAPPVDQGLSPEQLTLVAQLKAHIAKMSRECQEMWRYHLAGTGYDEIERDTGVSKNNLFQRWRRCRLALRAILNPEPKGATREPRF